MLLIRINRLVGGIVMDGLLKQAYILVKHLLHQA